MLVKGAPSVECQYMASIHYKCEHQPSICRHISDPTQDLGLVSTFEAPWGPQGKMAELDQGVFTWLSDHENRPKCPYLGSKRTPKYGPSGPIVLRIYESSSSERNKVSSESSINILQNKRKTGPWGPIFHTFQKIAPMGLKKKQVLCESCRNFLQNRRKFYFDLILAIFG